MRFEFAVGIERGGETLRLSGFAPRKTRRARRFDPQCELAARRQFTLRIEPAGAASLSWREPGKPQRFTAALDANGKLETHARGASNAASFIDILHMTAGIPGGFDVGM